MKLDIVNKYEDANIIEKPVSNRSFTAAELIAFLEEAARAQYGIASKQKFYPKVITQIHMFGRFLEHLQCQTIVLNESLLEDFRSFLESGLGKDDGKSYGIFTVNAAVDNIRRLFDRHFGSKGLIARPFLKRKTYLKYRRFLNFSEITKKLIIAYEQDGRYIKSRKKYFDDLDTGCERFKIYIERRSKRLSPLNRSKAIANIMTVLETVGKCGVEDLTQSELDLFLDIYRKKEQEDRAYSCFASLYSVVANGIALGTLSLNPFDNFSFERRSRRSRQDFIPPDQIKKLLDLSTVKWNDFHSVRGRCLTVLLYDTAFRASTAVQLDMSAVRERLDGRCELMVKGSLLKGSKDDRIFHILFQETVKLLKHWIHTVRSKLNCKTDRLFISASGKPLTQSGIGNIVRDCCKELGILTAKSAVPYPHVLRHTFATLNIEPFGKSLSPRLMQQRMVHIDLRTLESNYIHNNPLAEIEEYKKLFDRDSKSGLFKRIDREDLFNLLDTLSSARPASVQDVKAAYDREMQADEGQTLETEQVKRIGEREVLKQLSAFKMDYRSIRMWALRQGFCHTVGTGESRSYFYDECCIIDLEKNYMSTEAALRKFSEKRGVFYRRLKQCKTIRIGKRTLVLKNDFLRFILGDRTEFSIRAA